MEDVLITLLVCLVIYEIFEHLILPLFWMIRSRTIGNQLAVHLA